MIDPALERSIIAFIHAEARALDEQRFDDWLALFAEDGIYWVPGAWRQPDPQSGFSLYYERKPLLALRLKRLAETSLHAAAPRTHHHVGAIEIAGDDMSPIVHSSLIVAERAALAPGEWRAEATRWSAGRARHALRRLDDGWRIVEKRVELIDCDAPHAALVVPF